MGRRDVDVPTRDGINARILTLVQRERVLAALAELEEVLTFVTDLRLRRKLRKRMTAHRAKLRRLPTI